MTLIQMGNMENHTRIDTQSNYGFTAHVFLSFLSLDASVFGASEGTAMVNNSGLRPKTIESVHDEELAQLEHLTPGPWNDAAPDGFSPSSQRRQHPHSKHRIAVRINRPDRTSGFLPILPAASTKRDRKLTHTGLDASPVVDAYNELLNQQREMAIERANNVHQRLLDQQALIVGSQHLSADRVQAEKDLIRFNALKNEVDIFQQYLDPFIFEMRTPREHSVHSSVYRHYTRMQSVQDLGIPIYSLGAYGEDPSDKFIMPRTFESFYRRIRRRNAADFIDASLVSRPPRRPLRAHRDEQG